MLTGMLTSKLTSLATTVRRCVLIAACAGVALACGCASNLPFGRDSAGREQTVGPGRMTPSEIQSEVMSFTDSFNAAITQSWSGVSATGRANAAEAGFLTPEGERATALRRAALEVNLSNATASLSIASSPNPFVALADMVTLVTLQRMVLETTQAAALYGPELQARLLEVYRVQEERIWRVAQRAMTPEQQQELREMIGAWREENPDATYVSYVRLEDFGSRRQQGVQVQRQSSTGLLALFALDPMAGLDPAQREVARSRLLAERVFFFTSRAGNIVKWNVELLYQNLLRAPEFNQFLASIKQASDSTVRFSALAEALPDKLTERLSIERQRAVEQVFSELTKERQALMQQLDEKVTNQRRAAIEDLERAQGGLKGTFAEFRESAAVASKLTEQMTTLVHATDGLAGRFGADGSPRDPERNALAEFKDAADRTGATVERMTRLVERIESLTSSTSTGGVRSAMHEMQMGTNELIDRTFWRLVVLGLLIPFSTAAAYRWVAKRGA